jgi:hypothetical protein
MKVALIGNMNNNNFSMMRYLRDLGLDAYLLITDDDGKKSNAHFCPENDTYFIESWRPYIIEVPIGFKKSFLLQCSGQIKTLFQEYDILIASGLIPAILKRCLRKVDIYYPYAVGIEYIEDSSLLFLKNRFGKNIFLLAYKYLIAQFFRYKMIQGLYNSKVIVTSELFHTGKKLNDLGFNFTTLDIPMLYNREGIQLNAKNVFFESIRKKHDIVLFSHVSHTEFKNKFPILESLKKIIERTDKKVVLILVEYGNCIKNTKDQISRLGIEGHVLWIPPTSRIGIIELFRFVDFGFSEFDGMLWGGSGWEFLAEGVPFFHFIDYDHTEFTKKLGYPMPPIFNSKSPIEICEIILSFSDNIIELKTISNEMKSWFDEYGGIGLAKKWKSLIEEIYFADKFQGSPLKKS